MAQRLRQIQRHATETGRGKALVAAFRRIVQRLRRDAPNIGEGLYRLHALRMQVRTVVVLPLAVDFAVCEDRPVVIIKNAHLLSD